jgi:hypothetical protein
MAIPGAVAAERDEFMEEMKTHWEGVVGSRRALP